MPNNRDNDTVTLEVRGSTLAELQEKAIALASEFFGIPADGAELRSGAIRARVTYYGPEYQPASYSAEVTVRLLSADEVRAEGEEPSEP